MRIGFWSCWVLWGSSQVPVSLEGQGRGELWGCISLAYFDGCENNAAQSRGRIMFFLLTRFNWIVFAYLHIMKEMYCYTMFVCAPPPPPPPIIGAIYIWCLLVIIKKKTSTSISLEPLLIKSVACKCITGCLVF